MGCAIELTASALAVLLLVAAFGVLPRESSHSDDQPRFHAPNVADGSRGSAFAQEAMYFGLTVEKKFMSTDHLLFRATEYPFALVADLDIESRCPNEFKWQSYLQSGVLHWNAGRYTVELGERTTLYSHTATKNRSMELSELVTYRHRLFAMCDYTGLIFKACPYNAGASCCRPVSPRTSQIQPGHNHVFQRYAIADGDGDEAKPFKTEWATVKDGVLWVGSVGKEWVVGDRVMHRNAEWVKAIYTSGRIENYDWGPVYQALRFATNTSSPGYLWHEAVHWDAYSRRWIFLPRKASHSIPYDPISDEVQGSNLLIVASENFRDISVRRLGPLEPEYGFTSVRKLPGSEDMFMALKVKEVAGQTHTKLVVFDLSGRLFLDNGGWFDVSDVKYEGLDFVM